MKKKNSFLKKAKDYWFKQKEGFKQLPSESYADIDGKLIKVNVPGGVSYKTYRFAEVFGYLLYGFLGIGIALGLYFIFNFSIAIFIAGVIAAILLLIIIIELIKMIFFAIK